MNNNLPNDDAAAMRRVVARRAVTDAITITGRQVPAVLEESAAMLLAALWQASEPFGVQPEDWAAVAALPMSCLDVLAAVERRPQWRNK